MKSLAANTLAVAVYLAIGVMFTYALLGSP